MGRRYRLISLIQMNESCTRQGFQYFLCMLGIPTLDRDIKLSALHRHMKRCAIVEYIYDVSATIAYHLANEAKQSRAILGNETDFNQSLLTHERAR